MYEPGGAQREALLASFASDGIGGERMHRFVRSRGSHYPSMGLTRYNRVSVLDGPAL